MLKRNTKIYVDNIDVFNNTIDKNRLKSYISSSGAYFTPIDVQKSYGLNYSLCGNKRVNIAVIELGGTYNINDLYYYWNSLGIRNLPVVKSIYIDGYKPSNSSDSIEVVLDVEIIGAICPNSNIYVYFAPNSEQGVIDAFTSAVNNTQTPFTTISFSWGAPENLWNVNAVNGLNNILKRASNLGITVCTACGDYGATDGENDGKLHVDFPSSSPYVLSCGGTTLICPSKTYKDSTTIEKVWSYTGGGFSNIFTRPSYQNGFHTNINRGVPDVAGDADPSTGWIIYYNKNYVVVGGTSAVAPLWSAFLANIQSTNKRQWLVPNLYNIKAKNPLSFHDITEGNNGYYYANSDPWDACTGLGTPNGNVIYSMIANIKTRIINHIIRINQEKIKINQEKKILH